MSMSVRRGEGMGSIDRYTSYLRLAISARRDDGGAGWVR